MTKSILKFGISRISLISFILLCSLLTIENAFSLYWDKQYATVTLDQKEHSITFDIVFHQYSLNKEENGHLSECTIYYSIDGRGYGYLINAYSKYQKDIDLVRVSLHDKMHSDNIQVMNAHNSETGIQVPSDKVLATHVIPSNEKIGTEKVTCKMAHLILKWKLTEMSKVPDYIKITGKWNVHNARRSNKIDHVYPMSDVKSNKNTIIDTPSGFNSEISDKVTVTVETDAINVTGAEPGENIIIYTVTGVEVKSVATNDAVVNIKLPKNQIYVVKAGQARYKVAL